MKHTLLTRPSWRISLLRFGMILTAISSFGLASAQTNVTIGTGTATNQNNPMNTNYGYSYAQQIYYASELTAQGVGAGQINKIRFYTTSGAPVSSDGWRLLIGHTTKTQFTSTTDWEVIANLTEVFNGTVTFPTAANNWMEITLTTPFIWNGTSNLVIALDENVGGYGTVTNWRNTASTGINRSIYYRSDTNNPDPSAPPTATGRQALFPNLQLEMVPTIDCSTTTLAHANAQTTAANVCTDGTATLSLNNPYFLTGITYQWQFNDGGSGWNDISGATNSTYVATNLTTTGDYQAIVGCSTNSTTDISSEVTVTVNPYPVVVIDHTDIALCGGEPANLTASGADTYLWSPTTLLTPNATSAAVNVIPATTTTYTVVGTTTAGCSASATALITPLPFAKGDVVYSTPANEICAPGSPITISVENVPAEITSGGTWEYRFLSEDGTVVLQDWSASNEFTFTPPTDGVYGHFYQLRSTSCPGDNIDSVYSEITVGFGADVEITNFNCNSDGIIALENAFGQIEIEELYNNPLNNLGDMTGFTLAGNASVTNNRLQLTASATGVTGYGTLSIPGFEAGMNNSMTVAFDMTADTPINTYGTGGADGIAYSFGPDATSGAAGTGHNGKGSKLRLSFDAAGNSSENNNQAGIYLVYGWTAANAFGPASAQTLAYSANTSLWKLKTDIPVVLSINTEGKATVTVDGQVVFENIQLPASYMTEDVSTWNHLFSAQTGGDAMRQAVSNLSIEAGSLNFGITSGGTSTPPTTWQTGTSFEDLLPGTYNIWISKDEAATCARNLGTFEILNTNPIVALGNDTTLCEGDVITLDAGNTGATYVWSNTNDYTQTIEVSEAGNYVVYVTDTVGCLGIGTINVDYNEGPSVSGIYAQGSFPMMNFSAIGAENAASINWNFGDGNTVQNGPSSISHMYAQDGTYTVTVTVTNDCGTASETTSITIIDYAGVEENELTDLEVYPNPSSALVNLSVQNNEVSEYTVFAVSGALVKEATSFSAKTSIDVSAWESGVYFLQVNSQGKSTVRKIIVE